MLYSNKQRGFTLVEIMIVVAMVAILATIAVGSYRDSAVRAHRAAAVSYMLEVSNMQERYLLDNRDYAPDMATLGAVPPAEVSDFYTVTTADDNGASNVPSYYVRAVPKGSQATSDTSCGTMELDNLGNRSDAGGDRCWR